MVLRDLGLIADPNGPILNLTKNQLDNMPVLGKITHVYGKTYSKGVIKDNLKDTVKILIWNS